MDGAIFKLAKKKHQRHLFLLSLGKEMVRPHLSRRADTGNFKKCIQSAMRKMSVSQLLLQPRRKTEKTAIKKVLSVQEPSTEKKKTIFPVIWMGKKCHSIKVLHVTGNNCSNKSQYKFHSHFCSEVHFLHYHKI